MSGVGCGVMTTVTKHETPAFLSARRYWAPLVASGVVVCHLCGVLIPGRGSRGRGRGEGVGGKGVGVSPPWHLDHLVPRALGGTDDASNLHPAHARCNTQAGGRLSQRMGVGQARKRKRRWRSPKFT